MLLKPRKALAVLGAVTALAITLAACTQDTNPPPASAQDQAQNTAATRQNYVPKNDVEGKNYNARIKLADDPATLIWCTAFPTNPNAQAITVPIVGKLTSSSKRPYSTSQVQSYYQSGGSYSPEIPGPDGMFGSSSEYRYGFRPDGVYVDFTGLETFCTSEPSVYQKQHTIIDLESTGGLNDATTAAETALKACQAVSKDPTKPCAAAQAALVAAASGK